MKDHIVFYSATIEDIDDVECALKFTELDKLIADNKRRKVKYKDDKTYLWTTKNVKKYRLVEVPMSIKEKMAIKKSCED